MNPLWKRLSEQVGSEKLAKEILINRGHMSPDGNLTREGERLSALGADGRAKERAAKKSGGHPDEYWYDPITNKAKRIKIEI